MRSRLARDLVSPVTLTLITSFDTGVTCVSPDAAPPLINDANRPYLPLARQVLEEVTGLSPLITLRVVQYSVVDDTVAEFRITHVPTILIQGTDATRPLYYVGTPLGHEFHDVDRRYRRCVTGQDTRLNASDDPAPREGDRADVDQGVRHTQLPLTASAQRAWLSSLAIW